MNETWHIPLIARKVALARGLKRYFTGDPCLDGHTAERLVSNGACIVCNRIKAHAYAKRKNRIVPVNCSVCGLPRNVCWEKLMKKWNTKQFNDWEDAFNYCREVDHPVIVEVHGEIRKIFPSGSASLVAANKKANAK